jgi:hypothetical protein
MGIIGSSSPALAENFAKTMETVMILIRNMITQSQ